MSLDLLKQAAAELERLKRENEILRAKAQTVDAFAAALRAGAMVLPLPGSNLGEVLQIQIERESAIAEMKSQQGEEMLSKFNEGEAMSGNRLAPGEHLCPECHGLKVQKLRVGYRLCFYCGGTGRDREGRKEAKGLRYVQRRRINSDGRRKRTRTRAKGMPYVPRRRRFKVSKRSPALKRSPAVSAAEKEAALLRRAIPILRNLVTCARIMRRPVELRTENDHFNFIMASDAGADWLRHYDKRGMTA